MSVYRQGGDLSPKEREVLARLQAAGGTAYVEGIPDDAMAALDGLRDKGLVKLFLEPTTMQLHAKLV